MSLWHNRDFLRFWFGETVSLLGTQITNLALPLTAITAFGGGALGGLTAGLLAGQVGARGALTVAALASAAVVIARRCPEACSGAM